MIDQIYGQGVDLSDEQLDNIIEFENLAPQRDGDTPSPPPAPNVVEDKPLNTDLDSPEDVQLSDTASRGL